MNTTKPNTPPTQESSVALKITVGVILVLILGGLVWLGSLSKQQAQRTGGIPQLTDAEKAVILENLRNTKAPDLSEKEKTTILENLRNTKAPELTEAEKARILESLRNTQ